MAKLRESITRSGRSGNSNRTTSAAFTAASNVPEIREERVMHRTDSAVFAAERKAAAKAPGDGAAVVGKVRAATARSKRLSASREPSLNTVRSIWTEMGTTVTPSSLRISVGKQHELSETTATLGNGQTPILESRWPRKQKGFTILPSLSRRSPCNPDLVWTAGLSPSYNISVVVK